LPKALPFVVCLPEQSMWNATGQANFSLRVRKFTQKWCCHKHLPTPFKWVSVWRKCN